MNKSNAKEELLRNAIRGGLSEEDLRCCGWHCSIRMRYTFNPELWKT